MMARMTDRPTPPVTLVPMSAVAWTVFRERSVREYAQAKVQAGTWTSEQATELAASELCELLPDGPSTAGHELRSVIAADGTVVGAVWLGPPRPGAPGPCFVWDVHVEPAFRGRGYGRATMLAAEALAGAHGCAGLGLHVFADNAVARALYRGLGYVETDVSMRKDLSLGPQGAGRTGGRM